MMKLKVVVSGILLVLSAQSLACAPTGDLDCWVRYTNNYVYAEGNTNTPTMTGQSVPRLTTVPPPPPKQQNYQQDYLMNSVISRIPYIPSIPLGY